MFENIGKNTNWPIRCLSFFLAINKEHWIDIDDLETYKLLGVTSRGQGVQIKRIVTGSELRMRKYQVASANQLMWCKVDTKNGAFSITRDMHKGSMVSPNMCLADIDMTKCIPDFLQLFFQLPVEWHSNKSAEYTRYFKCLERHSNKCAENILAYVWVAFKQVWRKYYFFFALKAFERIYRNYSFFRMCRTAFNKSAETTLSIELFE